MSENSWSSVQRWAATGSTTGAAACSTGSAISTAGSMTESSAS